MKYYRLLTKCPPDRAGITNLHNEYFHSFNPVYKLYYQWLAEKSLSVLLEVDDEEDLTHLMLRLNARIAPVSNGIAHLEREICYDFHSFVKGAV